MSKFDLDDIIRKVQALVDRANHPNTPPAERDSCEAMAESLMFKYRIEEIQVANSGEAPELLPQWKTLRVGALRSEFLNHYASMASYIASHTDVMYRSEVVREEEGSVYTYQLCGYEAELRYAEMLFVSASLAFGQKLEPKYDPNLSEQENAYNMRSAGMEGRRIAMAIYGRDDKSLRPKVRKMFEKEAAKRGEDPSLLLGRKGASMKTYRKSYADGFISELYWRLSRMRSERGQENQEMVLASARSKVEEEFYTRYPRPKAKLDNAQVKKAPNEECPKCQKAKSGYCREHSYLKPRTGRVKAGTFSGAAYERGKVAAQTVDLGPSSRGKLEG